MPPQLADALRRLQPALAQADDAGAEVLALIWGPRFDREHAHALLARLPGEAGADVLPAAERFDALRAHQQQRLRRMAVRAASAALVDNGACPASC